MRAKLGDLGAARFSDASLSVGLVSPDYTAPERMDGRSAQKSRETDMYSMGVSLCELFTGIPPHRLDQVQLVDQEQVHLLCTGMIAHDADRRLSATEALTGFGSIRETNEYKACPPRRMVKGNLDGVENVTLTDNRW